MTTIRYDLIRWIEEKCIENALWDFTLYPPRGCGDVPYIAVFQDGTEVDGWCISSPANSNATHDSWWNEVESAFHSISQHDFGDRILLCSKPTKANANKMTCRRISLNDLLQQGIHEFIW